MSAKWINAKINTLRGRETDIAKYTKNDFILGLHNCQHNNNIKIIIEILHANTPQNSSTFQE